MISYALLAIKKIIEILDYLIITIIIYFVSFLPKVAINHFYKPLYQAWLSSFIRALGVTLKLHQHNSKPLPKQYLLIANHPSSFEDIGVPALFNVICVAKIEVGDWFIFGRIAKSVGTLFVKRESKESRGHTKEEMIAHLKKGYNIAIYPEGGCKGRRLQDKFLYGVFDVSIRTGIPIIPVFLHYESQDDFEWLDTSLLKNIWSIFKSKNKVVNYHVFDPLLPEQFENEKDYAQSAHEFFKKQQARFLE